MKFRASFCDPLKPDIIEIGKVEQNKIMELFENIPWKEHLEKMKKVDDKDIYYSPSLEIENLDNKNGISISAIDENEWYIFYKRPKRVRKLFGLIETLDNNYVTEIQGQTTDDVKMFIKALIKNDLHFLENKIKD